MTPPVSALPYFVRPDYDPSRFGNIFEGRRTLKSLARKYGVSSHRVKSVLRWFGVRKGKDLDDFKVPYGPKGPFVFELSEEFEAYLYLELIARGFLTIVDLGEGRKIWETRGLLLGKDIMNATTPL